MQFEAQDARFNGDDDLFKNRSQYLLSCRNRGCGVVS
jgi:hypothetical protein